jgi:hypothetical protein
MVMDYYEAVRRFVLIAEEWVTDIPKANKYPKEIPIFKNPSRKEIRESAGEYNTIRAFLVGRDAYVWEDALHNSAAASLNMDHKEFIPLSIYLDDTNSKIQGVNVTDFSNRTKWESNGKVYGQIISHPFIKRYAEDVNDPDFVNYYNEAIVGKWHE